MDTNLLFAVLIPVLFTLIIADSEEGVVLLILGFLSIALFFNLNALFGITKTNYESWGAIIQTVYLLVGLFSISKTYYLAQSQNFDIFFGKFRKAPK